MKVNKAQFVAVLWDMDGTLIDSEALHFQAMSRVLESQGVEVLPELQQLFTGWSESEVFLYCQTHFSISISREEWSAQRNAFYLAGAAQLLPRPGALEVFRQLDRAGVKQAIVSNSDRVLVDANLRVLGLHERGLVSVSRSEVRCAKPDPEPYLLAADQLAVPPPSCVVVEDSLPGAQSGRAAGMHVLYWPQTEPGGGKPSLSEIQGFVPLDSADELKRELAGLLGEVANALAE